MLWRGIHRPHSWRIRQDGPLSKYKILIPIGSFSFRSQAMLKLGYCRSEIRTLGKAIRKNDAGEYVLLKSSQKS